MGAQRARFLQPGDTLGTYHLIRRLAVGGMAEIHLARRTGIEGFQKLAVVKCMLPQFAAHASFVNMFLAGARLAAMLQHPNIVQVYDIGQEHGEVFFSMEYVHGQDLGRILATSIESGISISLDAALTLVVGLCAGLHHAHEKVGANGEPLGVVHRDVSPSNVLVSYDGAVKLVDFGTARTGSSPISSQTKGKVEYMSPEQCRGKVALDRRSDVFSVGTILYELTTGKLPFADETEHGVLAQIAHRDAERPSKRVRNYPPALESIVMKALARDLDKRYASTCDLQAALEVYALDHRLRVSGLVLSRLMSTLFPARLGEWEQAQDADSLEPQLVRTLVEKNANAIEISNTGRLPLDESVPLHAPLDGVDEDASTTLAPPSVSDDATTNVVGSNAIPLPIRPPVKLIRVSTDEQRRLDSESIPGVPKLVRTGFSDTDEALLGAMRELTPVRPTPPPLPPHVFETDESPIVVATWRCPTPHPVPDHPGAVPILALPPSSARDSVPVATAPVGSGVHEVPLQGGARITPPTLNVRAITLLALGGLALLALVIYLALGGSAAPSNEHLNEPTSAPASTP